MDGNVLRVLSRLRGIGAPIDNQKVVDHMWKLADDIVDKGKNFTVILFLVFGFCHFLVRKGI